MMKRTLLLLLAALMILMPISACRRNDSADSPGTHDGGTASSDTGGSSNQVVDASDLASLLKGQFSETEKYIYTEPLYNLPRDFRFVLQGESFKQKDWNRNNNITDVVRVFVSSSFHDDSYNSLVLNYDVDDRAGEMTVWPWEPAFNLRQAGGEGWFDVLMDSENDWGNASKYYLVQYVDLDTGAKLEKPRVTLFTVKAELDAPQVKYRVDEEGRGIFYWKPISGAQAYVVGKLWIEDGDARFSQFEQIDVVTETQWSGLGDQVTTHRVWGVFDMFGIDIPEWYKDSTALQNYGYGNNRFYLDEDTGYCVIAVKDGSNSNISNIPKYDDIAPLTPYTTDMRDAYRFDGGSLVLEHSSDLILVPDVESAPLYHSVEMIDGSTKQFLIEYPDSVSDLTTHANGLIITRTHGTLFLNGIVIDDTGGRSMDEALQYLKAREKKAAKVSGGVADMNNMSINDVPSVETDFGNNSSYIVIDSEGQPSLSGVPLPDEIVLFDHYANSPLSAYVAICLLNRIEAIPLHDFPEAADGAVAVEAFFEAYFQNNAYIGGVEWPSVAYDFITRTLYVPYVMTPDEHRLLRMEVDSKADEIIEQIIDSQMSDYQKQEAINNYLCANAEYDWDALDAMMAMPSAQAIATAYKYSQTAYGILVDNMGICQAYAEAFNVLAIKAGLQSVVVVGVLNGLGGHAWNRVMLDGQWFTLDVTNNDNDLYYNEFFNMPDEVAALFVTEWGIHLLDAVLWEFTAYSYGYDYFSRNGMSTDIYGLEDYLVANLGLGDNFEVVIIDIIDMPQEDLIHALQNAAERSGINYKTRLALWVLRIEF